MKKGNEFTPAQRAKFFCEGRATCALTGKSLWILDYGATPFWEYDWADHIKPRSRRGKGTDDNGVCTSSHANSKKSNNSRDKHYLFRCDPRSGSLKLTHHFCYWHGKASKELLSQLRRLSALRICDWYFNRALSQVLFGLKILLDGQTGDRSFKSHLESAWKFLQIYQRKAEDVDSFEKRLLIKRGVSADVRLMLDLREASSLQNLKVRVQSMYPHYEANCTALHEYINAKTAKQRAKILIHAKNDKLISKLVLEALESYEEALLPVFDADKI